MKKIIIAEDDAQTRTLLKSMLEDEFQNPIETCSSGNELEKRIQERYSDVGVFIIDNQMHPGKTGLEIIHKYSDKKDMAPFVLQSGDYIEKPEDYNVASFLKKPYEIDAMIKQVKKALKV